MACPVLGDASIIHRLRSLTMSDISPRRRLRPRALIGATALALPLTASFSYAAAQTQDNAVPPPPPLSAPPAAVAPPPLPAPPAPEARDERRVQRYVFRTPRDRARDRRLEQRFALRGNARQWPGTGQWPHVQMNFQGNPLDPEFQKRMEQYSRDMAEWSRKYGQQWERWSQQFNGQWAEQMRRWGKEQGEQARRFARVRPVPMPAPLAVPQPPQPGVAPAVPQPPQAWAGPRVAISPEALQRCRGGDNASSETTLPDGRRQVVICNRGAPGQALNSLRATRDRIARNSALSEDVRRDVLQDLDREIERLQRGGDDN
jgi:hypothetical protein